MNDSICCSGVLCSNQSDIISNYSVLLEHTVTKLDEPTRIFNGHEIGMSLDPLHLLFLSRHGYQNDILQEDWETNHR